jgi:predicted dehydrogenase
MSAGEQPSDRKTAASRRRFINQSVSALAAGSAIAGPSAARPVHAAGSDLIRIGLVGCGGRGTGATVQALYADVNTKLVAVADAFEDRIDTSLKTMSRQPEIAARVNVDPDHRFVGFDAYKHVLGSDLDVVLLATPPHFRPLQLRAAIEAGKHVFAEKPVAVDGPGVRHVLETTELAKQKQLSIVSGLNTRYSPAMQELIGHIHEGAIGDITAAHAVRYAGGVWVRPREPGMTEMEYQMRNWYYFTWLSGDFNVEQFVHQYDLIAWAMQNAYPQRCYSTGGRQARTGKEYGQIFDHFSSVFEYESGARAFTTTRHQRGCSNESKVVIMGTKGEATLSRRNSGIIGEFNWQPPDVEERDSHQIEHDDFFAALRRGEIINNGHYMAHSTMVAILARMGAYTGQSLSWEQGINSKQDLSPSSYDWDGVPVEATVAIPGVTKFA